MRLLAETEQEEEIMPKKVLRFILINALVVFVVGLILLLLGYNIYFDELFYDNAIMYAIFSVITNIGDIMVYIVIIVVVWYAFDKRVAKNTALSLLLGGAYANAIIKDTFRDPRPWTARDVTGYGFPSGHSQSSTTTYGYLAYKARKHNKIVSWILIAIIYIVAVSRVIIGVHDIQDIWGGLLIGMLFVTLFIVLEPKFSAKINPLSLPIKLVLSIVIPIILFIVATLIFPESEDYGLDCGAMIGLLCGYLVECETIKYDPSVLTGKQKVINLIIGLLITFALYFILSFIPLESNIWELFQYFILSFLLATLNPWIFTKINKK